MGFLNFLQGPDINQGINEYGKTAGAVLLDVRTVQEYREGHIPDSQNLPLQSLEGISKIAGSKDTPLFVYCHSGSRSRQAVGALSRMGYTSVKNIGGIAAYSGKVVH
ncbi:rhodanese-like domain-containing protein [Luxibacter massiliensis]|uniref:rhodanese-like domain-containing protein n=1 Tax=Luxibacter massiliensis TaxID=2219695 RepID=UPI000F045D2E|nr:rhodanese-like domain-containing protein [Luxibacter massiliensis]